MEWSLVLGLGSSGQATAEWLLRQGHSVLGIDRNADTLHSQSEIHRLEEKGLKIQNESSRLPWDQVDRLIFSSGIQPSHSLVQQARDNNIEAIGEAEFAFRHLQNRAVAITGTNGKTTVTLLVEHVLKQAGLKAVAVGNVGRALMHYLLSPDLEDILVTELSSFQLESMSRPVFDAGAILNITPDHLDRYPSMEQYAYAKLQLSRCLKKGAPLYLQASIAERYTSLVQEGSFKTYEIHSADLFSEKRGEHGDHEKENLLAAWALVTTFGVTKETFLRAIESFKKPPHRIQFVEKIRGVLYFDDSKGTNIDAVIQAVKVMPSRIVLIAGGLDKGASYIPWKKAFSSKVKKIVTIGQAASQMIHDLKDSFDIVKKDSLRDAVKYAALSAEPGECVLLSPGCASYDMFIDYAHRGRVFQQEVMLLKGENYEP